MGVGPPPDYPLKLNLALDFLLKKEFDRYRALGVPHPIMTEYGISAVPLNDPRMDEWRDALRRGVTRLHNTTNLVITGGVDDIWINDCRELHVVDYKGMWTKNEKSSLDPDWQIAYKRQVEIYQWLLKGTEYAISDTAYFVCCNCDTDRDSFDGKLTFKTSIVAHQGDSSWVDATIQAIHECLMNDTLPAPAQFCNLCRYREAICQAKQRCRAK
jgi:hypothetical protein